MPFYHWHVWIRIQTFPLITFGWYVLSYSVIETPFHFIFGSSLLHVGATLHCRARASPWGGFSCCGAHALGVRASVVGPRPSRSMVSAILLDQGSNPCFPALAGRFLSTMPPGKSQKLPFKYHLFVEETKASSNFYRIYPYTGFGLHRWGVLSRLHHPQQSRRLPVRSAGFLSASVGWGGGVGFVGGFLFCQDLGLVYFFFIPLGVTESDKTEAT